MNNKFTRKNFEKGDLISLDNNVRSFRIYDCPVELINKCISYSKLYFDNQVWKVLEKGMNLIMNEEMDWRISVENRLATLEQRLELSEKGEEEIQTMGGE